MRIWVEDKSSYCRNQRLRQGRGPEDSRLFLPRRASHLWCFQSHNHLAARFSGKIQMKKHVGCGSEGKKINKIFQPVFFHLRNCTPSGWTSLPRSEPKAQVLSGYTCPSAASALLFLSAPQPEGGGAATARRDVCSTEEGVQASPLCPSNHAIVGFASAVAVYHKEGVSRLSPAPPPIHLALASIWGDLHGHGG